MIKVKNLKVWIDEKEILKWIDLEFELGKNYCLIWKNWSGKSTFASFLMWHPKYKYISWKVEIEGKNLLKLSPDERSINWLFLSFQNIPEINWITINEYLRTIYNIHLKNSKPDIKELSPFIFKRFIKKYLDELKISEDFLWRELNVWFSWGEKRKIEILQMKLIWPKYIILDEIDSWLDLDAFKTIASLLKNISNKDNTLIVITHYFEILKFIDIDKVYLIKDWKIIREWDKNLIDEIKKNGFE
jgi:Fe-S cluster assembly ATP-binding protein